MGQRASADGVGHSAVEFAGIVLMTGVLADVADSEMEFDMPDQILGGNHAANTDHVLCSAGINRAESGRPPTLGARRVIFLLPYSSEVLPVGLDRTKWHNSPAMGNGPRAPAGGPSDSCSSSATADAAGMIGRRIYAQPHGGDCIFPGRIRSSDAIAHRTSCRHAL